MSIETVQDVLDWLAVHPEPIECEETVRTNTDREVDLTDFGGALPDNQIWNESSKNTTNVIYTGPDDSYSITVERIDDITFQLSTDSSKTFKQIFDW